MNDVYIGKGEMKKVWVVIGQTGEYSDRREWNVAVYPDKEVAEQHARLAKEWCKEKGLGWSDRRVSYQAKLELCKTNPYDRNMDCDYTGVDYVVSETDWALHVDQYMGLD